MRFAVVVKGVVIGSGLFKVEEDFWLETLKKNTTV